MGRSITDNSIRLAAFEWLGRQVDLYGDLLPRELLRKGFKIGDASVPLISVQGIFKPQAMSDVPLSITTAPYGPYDDSFRPDGLLSYRYRGSDPDHRDNIGLRKAMQERVPLVYFHGVVPGKYLAAWPVFIVGDDPANLTFTVAVDDMAYVRIPADEEPTQIVSDDSELFARRVYITRTIRTRLHQQGFRERVLTAYRNQCACCRLRHERLLDAAHIIPDSEPEGEPLVQNGIAMCKLHHAAFDTFIIGVSPDYLIKVRPDVLREKDGPMLVHGLQGLNDSRIVLPHSQRLMPNRDLLDRRFQRFKAAV